MLYSPGYDSGCDGCTQAAPLCSECSQYLQKYDRQASPMLAFLMRYREILRLEGDNLKSNPAGVCRSHNRHNFISEFSACSHMQAWLSWAERGRGSGAVSFEWVIHLLYWPKLQLQEGSTSLPFCSWLILAGEVAIWLPLLEFILDMPLYAQLLKKIKRIKIIRSYVYKS